MKLAPEQVMGLLELPPETLRKWKETLRPIKRRKGYRPCYNLGDVLALAVVKVLVKDIGFRVGALAPVADALFDACHSINWMRVDHQYLAIDFAARKVHAVTGFSERDVMRPLTVIPLLEIVEQMRHKLLATSERAGQRAELALPLLSVVRRRS